MSHPDSNKSLLEALDYSVTGHLEAKKTLIVMYNRSKMRVYQKYHKEMHEEYLIAPLKVLLIGASGTGKTHLVETLKNIAPFPLVKIDATHLSPSGGSGGIQPAKLMTMIESEARMYHTMMPMSFPSLEYAIDRTVVYVDEIDKLGTEFESSGNWNRHVQSNFLTMFDNKDKYSGVSFIFSGAFDGITRKIVKNGIGFNKTEHVDTTHLEEKLRLGGLIPELIGRMSSIIELDIFTKDDYMGILMERIIPRKERDLAHMGVFSQSLADHQLEKIAEDAVRSGQGVRFMQREVDKIYMDIEFDAHFDRPPTIYSLEDM